MSNVHLKFGLPVCDCKGQLNEILNDINLIKQQLKTVDGRLSGIDTDIDIIKTFLFLNDPIEVWSTTPQLAGCGVSISTQGYTSTFSGIGALTSQQTLTNGTRYNIITASQYPPLQELTKRIVGTVWLIETNTDTTLPLFIDSTGIWIKPRTQLTNLPVGSTFNFTDTLISREVTT